MKLYNRFALMRIQHLRVYYTVQIADASFALRGLIIASLQLVKRDE